MGSPPLACCVQLAAPLSNPPFRTSSVVVPPAPACCVTVKDWPPTVIVPVRAALALAATE